MRVAIRKPTKRIERRHAPRAFTLVEVLVVVSTLALLLALLMPALAGARSQARGMVCRSNLRQLALANIGYATENDGRYVAGAKDMWDNAGRHRWHGTRTSLAEPFDPARGPLTGYLADGQVKECPLRIGFAKNGQWSANFEQGCGGYGYNLMYLGSRLWDAGLSGPTAFQQTYIRTASMDEVGNPGGTLMFADTAMANDGTTLIEYSFTEPPYAVLAGRMITDFRMSPSIHFRHATLANIAWSDGHVGAEPMSDLDEPNAYGIDSAALNLGWFAPADNSPFDLQ